MSLLQKLFGLAPKAVEPVTHMPAKLPCREPISPVGLPAKTYRFIAIDVETANSAAGSICQVGLAGIDDAGHLETTSLYVNPDDYFDDFNTNLHGIDAGTVANAPSFAEVLTVMRPLLESCPLVQHSTFDRKAMDHACTINDVPKLRSEWHDSVKIARRAWPQLKGNGGHGLANLKKHLGLVFEHHDAGEDARAAADVVLRAEHETGENFDVLSRNLPKKAFPTSMPMQGNENGPLYGQTACFTGALTMSRTEAATLAAAAGITIQTGVSKKTSLLVVGDQDLQLLAGHAKSSKHRRAEELIAQGHTVQILGETEFLKLLKQ